MSLVVILVGFITFNAVPTPELTASSSNSNGGYENPVATNQDVAVTITTEEVEGGQKEVEAAGCSTKM